MVLSERRTSGEESGQTSWELSDLFLGDLTEAFAGEGRER